MCTALSFNTKDHYFGRTLDLDRSYGEQICVLPRYFSIDFRKMGVLDEHYAIIGMATVVDGLPLFFDAANENGLAMAGLNFPVNAHYFPADDELDNVASFELIPWVLCLCKDVDEAEKLLSRVNIIDLPFSESIPPSPLHWMISDRERSIVVESTRDGLHIYDDPVGVLTNNPPFPYQLENLKQYSGLRRDNVGVVQDPLPYSAYSQGLGAVGLPGDLSSMSRFARIAFWRECSVSDDDKSSSIGQFFHLLSSVEMIRGACLTDDEAFDITLYTSCINTDRGLYYYTTYGNRRISCVDLHAEDLDSDKLLTFPLRTEESIDM